MIRRIITIDEEKCSGCGLCASACHEGAIGMVNGKAKLLHEHYCDGLGDCLPACPENAISFEEREAPAYDEAAVLAAKAAKKEPLPCGCPGTVCQTIEHDEPVSEVSMPGQLSNFPVQIKLVAPNAPYFDGADLLIAADCTAYAYGSFHKDFIRGKVTLIGCPKLDGVDYTEKLAQIIAENNVRSVRVARMQVPCCGGLEQAVRRAVAIAGSQNGAGAAGAVVGAGGADITGGAVDAVGAVASSIPVQIDVISSDGHIVAVG